MQPLGDRDPRRVGPFDLAGRLGVGTAGIVFLGRSVSGRQVAVKVVHEHLAADRAYRERFARDAAAARGVAGISAAQVVDADPDGLVPWVATRYVEGPSLADRVSRQGPLPVDQVLALAAGVAEALASIHAAGLVHGDLRPSKVIMSVDGPQVIGLGIGGTPDSSMRSSGTGEAAPAFEYLTPEQIQARPVGDAADVFALGGLLYYAVTGSPPFGSGHPGPLLHRIQHAAPDVSAIVDPRLRDLVARCLAKAPRDRLATGDVLALAAATGPAAGPAAPVSLTGSGQRPVPSPPPAHLLDAETVNAAIVDAETDPATSDLGERAEHPKAEHPKGEAEHPPGGNAPSRRSLLIGGAVAAGTVVAAAGGGIWWLNRPRPRTPDGPPYRELAGHPGQVLAVAYAPDGTTVATAGSDCTASIWDAADGAQRCRLVGLDFAPTSIAYAPDSRTVATGAGDGTAVLWDVATGTARRTVPVSDKRVQSVAYSPDGDRLATASFDGVARIHDLRTGRLLLSLPGHGQLLEWVAFSPDGGLLATADLESVRLWDARTGKLVRRLAGARGWAVFSPDGATLATGWSDKQSVMLWDAATGTRRRTLHGHTNGTVSGAFSGDGRSLVTASYDETARVWDVESGATRHTVNVKARVLGVAFAPDAGSFVTGGADGSAKVWDSASGELARALPAVRDRTFGVVYAPDGRSLATCGGTAGEPTVRIWDTASGNVVRTLTSHRGIVFAVAFAPDGRTLVSAGADQAVQIWDAASGTLLHELPHPQPVYGVAYAPDGKALATLGPEGTVRIWDPASGKPLRAIPIAASGWGVDYSPDGRYLAAAGGKVLHLIDPGTGQVARTFAGHVSDLVGVRFAPDGAVIATSTSLPAVRVWDVASGATVTTLVGHDKAVDAVAFAPSGRLLATASFDRTVRVWDWRAGTSLHIISGFRDRVFDVAFSPDGQTLATSCRDGTIRLWDLTRIPALAGPGS